MNLQLLEENYENVEKIVFHLLIMIDLNHDDNHKYSFAKRFRNKKKITFYWKLIPNLLMYQYYIEHVVMAQAC